MKIKLSKRELEEIKGGTSTSLANEEIDNNNGVSGCNCDYNNTGSSANNNGVPGCKCTCK